MFTRGSGILMHISSLPSPCGIGDLGPQAYDFVDQLEQAKQTYWQVLPLNPTGRSSFNSPYFSSSAIAGNPLLISLEALVSDGLLATIPAAAGSSPDDKVDYDAVTRFKYPLLEKAYETSLQKTGNNGFTDFCSANASWLDDFTLFIALRHHFNNVPWDQWPDQLRRRDAGALADYRQKLSESVAREKWYQFIFFTQWEKLKRYCNEKGILVIGDIPIYVSYDSVDVWTNPDIFKLDEDLQPMAVSGVPPDYFSATGQLWNNPVYNWDHIEKTGFAWWKDRMKAVFSRFDIVRIDHFRGLVQYWEVPAGEPTAINGSWQPVPTRSLFDTLLNEIPGFPVIAEDLGIITDDVRAEMDHYSFPGMKVLLFAFGEDNPVHPYLPHMYGTNYFVYTGTHDNTTVRGWFENEASEEDRERLLRYTAITDHSVGSVVWTCIRLAQSSVANVAIIPLQDLLLLGASARMNQPAQAEGNWMWRATPDQIRQLPVGTLAEMASIYGRIPPDRTDISG
ncbi:MAG: 4-alpha-glucanotransferase [Chitinispirillaceae bacterium]|nr:4-alpha-glucanotransferase [Chitinispirillaceae bacterium]